MWTYMGNHMKLRRNWSETLFSSSVLSLNLGFELPSAAKSYVCQEKFHINLKVFRDFSEKISCITREEWYNSRRNCPATSHAALKSWTAWLRSQTPQICFHLPSKKGRISVRSYEKRTRPRSGPIVLCFSYTLLKGSKAKSRDVPPSEPQGPVRHSQPRWRPFTHSVSPL